MFSATTFDTLSYQGFTSFSVMSELAISNLAEWSVRRDLNPHIYYLRDSCFANLATNRFCFILVGPEGYAPSLKSLKDSCAAITPWTHTNLQLNYKPGFVSCQEQDDNHSSRLTITN